MFVSVVDALVEADGSAMEKGYDVYIRLSSL